jgi:hypothetical protein
MPLLLLDECDKEKNILRTLEIGEGNIYKNEIGDAYVDTAEVPTPPNLEEVEKLVRDSSAILPLREVETATERGADIEREEGSRQSWPIPKTSVSISTSNSKSQPGATVICTASDLSSLLSSSSVFEPFPTIEHVPLPGVDPATPASVSAPASTVPVPVSIFTATSTASISTSGSVVDPEHSNSVYIDVEKSSSDSDRKRAILETLLEPEIIDSSSTADEMKTHRRFQLKCSVRELRSDVLHRLQVIYTVILCIYHNIISGYMKEN